MRSDWHRVDSTLHVGINFESRLHRPKGLQLLDMIGFLSLRTGNVLRLMVRRAGMGDLRTDLPDRWVHLVDTTSISFSFMVSGIWRLY